MTASTRTKIALLSLGLFLGAAVGWTVRGANDKAEDVARVHNEPPENMENGSLIEPSSAPESDESIKLTSDLPIPSSTMSQHNTAGIEGENPQDFLGDGQTAPIEFAHRAIPVSDAHAAIIRNQFTEDNDTGERINVREALESEAADDSWSYFMEQTLRIFISSHAEAAKFSIFHIECRTTMCEIQAIGFDESTGSDWSRILYDMSHQPWYEFGGVGTHKDIFQGQLAILTRLRRMNYTHAQETSD